MPKASKHTEKDSAAENLSSSANVESANANLSPALFALLEQHRTAIAADFRATFDVVNGKLDTIQAVVTGQGKRISDLESNAEDVGQRLANLEATCESLKKDNKQLKSKLSDLEGRSRRQNLRIVGLPESVEGPRPTVFFSQFLVEVFGAQTLPSPPELDRAHRSLVPKPGLNERPRAVIIRFHRFQTKDLVIREARKRGALEYRGHKILFYEDYTADVLQQRAEYKDVMGELYRSGFRPSLLFPAKLRITLPDGERRWLSSVQEATRFIKSTEKN
ncbi:hypothetical protein WMY93_031274 [Mugilogobius chulae]|uniref:L1 transposable element RRM domain-containing protein n=1 Tax=Mugilogobius chulae TaxID=88201 RepID=A0AAW0MDV5_9GOBI